MALFGEIIFTCNKTVAKAVKWRQRSDAALKTSVIIKTAGTERSEVINNLNVSRFEVCI